MKLAPIKSKKDYGAYLKWVDNLLEKNIKSNSAEGQSLQVALLLIKDYEDKHYQIPLPNSIDAIKLKMEERGLKNKDWVGKIGSKGYVSAVLSKRKPLTLDLAKLFHKELGIPADILLS